MSEQPDTGMNLRLRLRSTYDAEGVLARLFGAAATSRTDDDGDGDDGGQAA